MTETPSHYDIIARVRDLDTAFDAHKVDAAASITADIAGTVMTVSAKSAGTITLTGYVDASGIAAGTRVISQSSGPTGGVGAYEVSVSQTLSSRAMSIQHGPYFAAPGAVTRSGNINMQTGATIP